MARDLAEAITRLAVTAEERTQAREALLSRSTGPSMARELAEAVWIARVLAETVTRLDPAA